MNILSLFSNLIQLTGFILFYWAFNIYHSDRKGFEYSRDILKGAKMYKDENGIPNIKAESMEDGMFALGFAHAEDRLWQMYFNYKVGTGELSELYGSDALVIDKFARTLHFKKTCEHSVNNLDEKLKKPLSAYANGVNHYIKSTKYLPLEFYMFGVKEISWDLPHACIIGKLIEYYLTTDFYQETLRTYFKEKLKLPLEIIEKILPHSYDQYEYKRTIIKNDEMTHLRKKLDDTKENVIKEDIVKENNYHDKINDKINNSEINEELKINKEILNKENKIGSNNCVISGKLTKSGYPYLCNDPHLVNNSPSFWYIANIMINNEYHFIGSTCPGIPNIFMGTNGHIAWGITNGMVDTTNIVRVERKGDDYILDGKIYSFSKRTEKFHLNLAKTNSIDIDFYDTQYGPVISQFSDSLYVALGRSHIHDLFDNDKYFYILRSTYTNKNDLNIEALFRIIISKDINSFRVATSYLSICLNLVYADKKNIGYQLTGKIPKKTKKGSGSYIETFMKISDFIIENIPFEELPHVINPKKGYVVTSNNLVIGDDYKYIINGPFIMDSRARALEDEIENRIKSGVKIDTQFMLDNILKNVHDSYCRDIINYINNLILLDNEISIMINHYEEYKKLLNFNCLMKGDSFEALLFNVFESEIFLSLNFNIDMKNLSQNVRNHIIDADEKSNFLIYKLRRYNEEPLLCKKEYNVSCGKYLSNAFITSLNFIKEKNIDKWSDLNFKQYPHKPFSLIPFLKNLGHRECSTDGNPRTPKISLYHYRERDYKAIISSNFKLLINLNDVEDELYVSVDTGQSGRFFHRHYDDLNRNHENGKLIRFNKKFPKEFTLEFKTK